MRWMRMIRTLPVIILGAALSRMQEDFQADAEFDRNEILGAGARAMREVISELAAAKGLDMIVDVSNTLFFKPALDLSAEATAAYNRKTQAP